ncbi:MAG: hypothetical protein KDC54_18925, partial [Lewinella sp.]|nr:hypothetical protein [Lewinella sp.]
MKYFSGKTFNHPTQVSHEGKIIAFAVATEEDGRGQYAVHDICYRVLDVRPEVPRDEDNWSPLQKVPFSPLIQPAGMELIRVAAREEHTYEGTPFSVLSDGRHVYIFRQSRGRTLLVSRFLLLEVLDEERGETLPTLTIPWEVRYQRSRKRAVPASDKDSLGFRDMEDNPFEEPTFELMAVNQLEDGKFDVLIIPTNVPNKERWYFLSVLTASHSLRITSMLRARNGLFVLDKRDPALVAQLETRLKEPLGPVETEQLKAQLAAEQDKFSEEFIQLEEEGKPWRPATGLASLLYFQQVADLDDYGRQQILKRNGRLMLALGGSAAEVAQAQPVAALDFSGEEDGIAVNENSVSTGEFPFDSALQLGIAEDEQVDNPAVEKDGGDNAIKFMSTNGSYLHSGSYVAFETADQACTFDPWNGTIELRVKFPATLPERRMALVGFTGHDQYARLSDHIGYYWVLEEKKLSIRCCKYQFEQDGDIIIEGYGNLLHPAKEIPDSVLGDDKYHHLAVTLTVNPSTGRKTAIFYLDGVEHESCPSSSLDQDLTSIGGLWSIGCQLIKASNVNSPRDQRPGPFAVERFKGWIGEVAIWNEAKDAAAIAARASTRLTGQELHLVGLIAAGVNDDGRTVVNRVTGVSGTIKGQFAREEINAATGGQIQEPRSPTTWTSYLSFTEYGQSAPQFSAEGGTVELWLKTQKQARQALIDFKGSASEPGEDPAMGLVLFLEDNRLVLRHGHWARQLRSPVWSGNLSDGQWHHIALRIKRPDPAVVNYTVTFLVDGVPFPTQAANALFDADANSAGVLR